MAYGNWGAFVYKNDERMTDFEDNTPYEENEIQSGYWQAFFNGKDGINCHHAVLCDTELRLCGYKCYPQLLFKGEPVDLEQFYKGELQQIGDNEYLPDEYDMEFEFEGHKLKIETYENFVELWVESPSGDKWYSKCGYCYGAGHDD